MDRRRGRELRADRPHPRRIPYPARHSLLGQGERREPRAPELESAYGREANAHDVVYSANSQKENPASGAWPNFTWTARDDWTVDVDWAGHGADYTWENFRLLGNMTLRPVEAEGVDMVDWRNALGTGPFIWSNYVDGSVAEYVKNPNYWGTDPLFPENQQPYLDGFRMIPFAEIEAGRRGHAYRSDRPQLAVCSRSSRSAGKSRSPRPTPSSTPAWRQWRQAIFHMRQDLPGSKFADMRVRQAFMLAIPHQEVTRPVLRRQRAHLRVAGVSDHRSLLRPAGGPAHRAAARARGVGNERPVIDRSRSRQGAQAAGGRRLSRRLRVSR